MPTRELTPAGDVSISQGRRRSGNAPAACGEGAELGIVGGVQATEARELLAAAQAAGLGIEVVPFNTPAADAAIAAHGPGAVRLPLVIVGGRYCLQRPTFSAVLECLKVLRGTRCTLPAGCVVLGASG